MSFFIVNICLGDNIDLNIMYEVDLGDLVIYSFINLSFSVVVLYDFINYGVNGILVVNIFIFLLLGVILIMENGVIFIFVGNVMFYIILV